VIPVRDQEKVSPPAASPRPPPGVTANRYPDGSRQLEHRQVHRDDQSADHHAEETISIGSRSASSPRRPVDLVSLEVGDLGQHRVEGARGLPRDHLGHHRRNTLLSASGSAIVFPSLMLWRALTIASSMILFPRFSPRCPCSRGWERRC